MAGLKSDRLNPTLKAMMNARGYSSVYSLAKSVEVATGRTPASLIKSLQGNGHKKLLSYWNLSRALGITMDALAALLCDHPDPKDALKSIASTHNINSLQHLAIASRISYQQLFRMFDGTQKHAALYSYKPYADILKISLEDLTRLLLDPAHLKGYNESDNMPSEPFRKLWLSERTYIRYIAA